MEEYYPDTEWYKQQHKVPPTLPRALVVFVSKQNKHIFEYALFAEIHSQ